MPVVYDSNIPTVNFQGQAFETSWALVNKKKWSSKRDYAKLYQDWQKYRVTHTKNEKVSTLSKN